MLITETSHNARPFAVEHYRLEEKNSGSFVPAARLIVTPALRTSGLLAALPDAELRTLLLLLTFLSPNGHVQATALQMAEGLQISEGEMRRRLQRLTELRWQGEPVAYVQTTENGLERFSPSPMLLFSQTAPIIPPPQEVPAYYTAGRDAVIAYSRAHYSRPRAEVEAEIAAFLGHDPQETEDTPEAEARRKLSALGVARDQIALLFAEHSLESIQAQLEWLPYRGAKSPARFIVAAIQNAYAPPVGLRLPQTTTPPQQSEPQREPDVQPTPFEAMSLSIPLAPAKEVSEPEETPSEEAHV